MGNKLLQQQDWLSLLVRKRQNLQILPRNSMNMNKIQRRHIAGVTGSVVMSNGTDRVPEYFVFGTDAMGNYTFKLFISANLMRHSNSSTLIDADELSLVSCIKNEVQKKVAEKCLCWIFPLISNLNDCNRNFLQDISILGDGKDYWPTPTGSAPPDTPSCGFNRERCLTDYTGTHHPGCRNHNWLLSM